eukprot:CAMPEP_0177739728 /NCGR_PEP_ID=MMETSP0484_2-20121128/27182_1 /TAXON_ID=354590 /ORGANISM="Rhodomonas lens, Strain RHODO" /LENGTH=232 /DNA_ID=CAMNT_0019253813 /DNA_START=239 /DNA_END=934 /DNA_ORIENTATION=-
MKGKGAAKKQPPSPSPPPVSIERIKLADGATAEKFRSVPPPELSEKETKSQDSTTNVTKGYVSRRLPPQWLKVDFDQCLGAGGYGDTYEATIIGGPFKGTRAVAKRSLDGHRSGDTMSKTTSDSIADEELRIEKSKQVRKNETSAQRFLRVEAIVNQIVAKTCPQVAATYLGACQQGDTKWLVWKYEGDTTLQDLFARAAEEGSVECFAEALRVEIPKDSEGGFENEEDRAA